MRHAPDVNAASARRLTSPRRRLGGVPTFSPDDRSAGARPLSRRRSAATPRRLTSERDPARRPPPGPSSGLRTAPPAAVEQSARGPAVPAPCGCHIRPRANGSRRRAERRAASPAWLPRPPPHRLLDCRLVQVVPLPHAVPRLDPPRRGREHLVPALLAGHRRAMLDRESRVATRGKSASQLQQRM
jgi:hypothetical protein